MNKEDLQKRLADIDAALKTQESLYQQTILNINMLKGGRQEILYWLEQCPSSDSISLGDLKETLGAESIEVVGE